MRHKNSDRVIKMWTMTTIFSKNIEQKPQRSQSPKYP